MSQKFGLIDVLLIVIFIAAVYFILTRIFGNSASDLTISVTLFTLIGGLLYKLNREFGEFKIKTINSFDKIKIELEKLNSKRD